MMIKSPIAFTGVKLEELKKNYQKIEALGLKPEEFEQIGREVQQEPSSDWQEGIGFLDIAAEFFSNLSTKLKEAAVLATGDNVRFKSTGDPKFTKALDTISRVANDPALLKSVCNSQGTAFTMDRHRYTGEIRIPFADIPPEIANPNFVNKDGTCTVLISKELCTLPPSINMDYAISIDYRELSLSKDGLLPVNNHWDGDYPSLPENEKFRNQLKSMMILIAKTIEANTAKEYFA